ncbi:hypothetical protein [Acinetobacter baumannii]|uniref:hypothetical protein n=1 Tax=Acinetobacter baumannii TaxID=470 RepID=UPI000ADEE41D|nr:hypothetical protein [Acinetobacter baumannii]MDV7493139.1 hypothetical protein [Acinetobacter baumannii]UZG62108.1 hypothetical protein OMP06_18265 [Acinetobacter baumannii]HAV3552983.1 hypothetical protein [Acinetobacter baumannii]
MKNEIKNEYKPESTKISLDDFEKSEIETIDDELLKDISGAGGVTINYQCSVKPT